MNGCQGAMMAPTEVLAKQHYESITSLFFHIRHRQTGGAGNWFHDGEGKAAGLRKIASHEADIIVGTHALIQDKVHYDRLAWSSPMSSTGLAWDSGKLWATRAAEQIWN